MAGIEAALQAESVTQAGFELDRVGAVILLPAHRLERVGNVGPQDQVPVRVSQHRLDLFGGHPGGVGAANEGARTRAGNRVHGDAMFLEPAQHARMGHAFGRSSSKGEPDPRPLGRGFGREQQRNRGRQHDDHDTAGPCDGHPPSPSKGNASRRAPHPLVENAFAVARAFARHGPCSQSVLKERNKTCKEQN